MKKLLGIVVLGLLLSGNAFAEKNGNSEPPTLKEWLKTQGKNYPPTLNQILEYKDKFYKGEETVLGENAFTGAEEEINFLKLTCVTNDQTLVTEVKIVVTRGIGYVNGHEAAVREDPDRFVLNYNITGLPVGGILQISRTTGIYSNVLKAQGKPPLFSNGKCEKSKKKFITEKSKKQEPKKKKPKPSPDDNKVVVAASGSGFFVSNNGDIITNHHVIDQCKTVKVNFKGSAIEAKTLAIDKVNDIAILNANIKPDKVYSVSNEDVSLLEDVVVAGYPLGKKVSAAIKTHKGVVTSLAGAGDNYSNFQTDATINQGNSGGPIMNQKGNIVGIAVATWVEEGVQGVHFGIKSSTLKTFASANGLRFQPPNNRDLSNKDLGQLITNATVYLECHMTIAKIKKMIAEANNRKAFFSEYN